MFMRSRQTFNLFGLSLSSTTSFRYSNSGSPLWDKNQCHIYQMKIRVSRQLSQWQNCKRWNEPALSKTNSCSETLLKSQLKAKNMKDSMYRVKYRNCERGFTTPIETKMITHMREYGLERKNIWSHFPSALPWGSRWVQFPSGWCSYSGSNNQGELKVLFRSLVRSKNLTNSLVGLDDACGWMRSDQFN